MHTKWEPIGYSEEMPPLGLRLPRWNNLGKGGFKPPTHAGHRMRLVLLRRGSKTVVLLVAVWRHTGDKPSVSFLTLAAVCWSPKQKRTGSKVEVYRRPNLPK